MNVNKSLRSRQNTRIIQRLQILYQCGKANQDCKGLELRYLFRPIDNDLECFIHMLADKLSLEIQARAHAVRLSSFGRIHHE